MKVQELDEQSWIELQDVVAEKKIKAFYEQTESIFTSQKVQSWEDVLRLLAFAYSWMPTIPTLHIDKIDDQGMQRVVEGIQSLQCGDDSNLVELLNLMIPVFNNSVVGVSKMLHFAAPSIIPIVDSKVIANWKTLFVTNSKLALRSLYPSSDGRQVQRHIDDYCKFRNHLLLWQQKISSKPSIREIERALFLFRD